MRKVPFTIIDQTLEFIGWVDKRKGASTLKTLFRKAENPNWESTKDFFFQRSAASSRARDPEHISARASSLSI